MPFYRQTIGGHFYKDYKNGNSKRVSEKEYLKNVRRVKGGANATGDEEGAKSAVENKVIGSKKYTCECSCEKNGNNNENNPPSSSPITSKNGRAITPYNVMKPMRTGKGKQNRDFSISEIHSNDETSKITSTNNPMEPRRPST